jgi:hypothetical protein
VEAYALEGRSNQNRVVVAMPRLADRMSREFNARDVPNGRESYMLIAKRISLFILVVLMSGCYTTLQPSRRVPQAWLPGNVQGIRPEPNVTKSVVAELGDDMIPATAVFYTYRFLNYNDRVAEPEQLLKTLYAVGFEVTEAWYYRGSSSGCQPVGSMMGTGAIISPYFRIRLKESNDDILNYNFERIEIGRRMGCRYGIVRYVVEGN